jgi:hypothetical protein
MISSHTASAFMDSHCQALLTASNSQGETISPRTHFMELLELSPAKNPSPSVSVQSVLQAKLGCVTGGVASADTSSVPGSCLPGELGPVTGGDKSPAATPGSQTSSNNDMFAEVIDNNDIPSPNRNRTPITPSSTESDSIDRLLKEMKSRPRNRGIWDDDSDEECKPGDFVAALMYPPQPFKFWVGMVLDKEKEPEAWQDHRGDDYLYVKCMDRADPDNLFFWPEKDDKRNIAMAGVPAHHPGGAACIEKPDVPVFVRKFKNPPVETRLKVAGQTCYYINSQETENLNHCINHMMVSLK